MSGLWGSGLLYQTLTGLNPVGVFIYAGECGSP